MASTKGLSEHKHCDNAATIVIRTERTLEAEWWQFYGEAWVRGQRKMSQVLGAFGFLDVTAHSRLPRVFKLMRRFFNFPMFFRAAANRGC